MMMMLIRKERRKRGRRKNSSNRFRRAASVQRVLPSFLPSFLRLLRVRLWCKRKVRARSLFLLFKSSFFHCWSWRRRPPVLPLTPLLSSSTLALPLSLHPTACPPYLRVSPLHPSAFCLRLTSRSPWSTSLSHAMAFMMYTSLRFSFGFLLIVLHLFRVCRAPSNAEGNALIDVKSKFGNPSSLSSWNPDLVDPCSSWQGVSCTNQHVVSVSLPMYGLSGTLSNQIASLSELQSLVLQDNIITGGLPSEIGNLSNLVTLKLQNNRFTGPVPTEFGNLTRLKTLLLNDNNLTGEIPSSLTAIASTLTNLDLSNNSLNGEIPSALFGIQSFNFAGNKLNCGANYSHQCQQLNSSADTSNTSRSSSKTIIGVAVGLPLVFVCTLIFCYVYRCCARKRLKKEVFVDVPAEDDYKIAFGQLKRFSWRELQNATDDFNYSTLIGQGAFAKVYRGVLNDGTEVGVKRFTKSIGDDGGETSFLQEIEMISVAVHRNLLRLIGFCITPSERLLVYPYMPNKSVAHCLRERKKGEAELGWESRKKIALGSARGLEYLHHHCNPKIIHRDVKAANILLTEDYEAVVGDFGLAKLVDPIRTHVTTMVRGTMGHIAPEYLSTGKSTEKTDVFGYGVMLLELVTGQRAIDLSRLQEENDDVLLVDHVKRLQHQKRLETIVDPNLIDYDVKEVEQMIQVALLCSQPSPEDRPTMAEVVRMLSGEGLAERWEEWQQVEGIRRQEYESMPHRLEAWAEDSTVNQEAIQLSVGR